MQASEKKKHSFSFVPIGYPCKRTELFIRKNAVHSLLLLTAKLCERQLAPESDSFQHRRNICLTKRCIKFSSINNSIVSSWTNETETQVPA